MKKKVTRCLALVLMLVALSLCFAGCDLNFGGNSGGGSTGGGSSTTTNNIVGIDLVGSIKTTYHLGDELELNNAKLKVLYSDDTEKEISLLSSMATGFTSSVLGNYTMKITYKGQSINKNYIVTANGDYSADEDYGMYMFDGTTTKQSSFSGTDNDGLAYKETYTLTISDSNVIFYAKRELNNQIGSFSLNCLYEKNNNIYTSTKITRTSENMASQDFTSDEMTVRLTVNKQYVEFVWTTGVNQTITMHFLLADK